MEPTPSFLTRGELGFPPPSDGLVAQAGGDALAGLTVRGRISAPSRTWCFPGPHATPPR